MRRPAALIVASLLTAACASAVPRRLAWRPGGSGTQEFRHEWPERLYAGPAEFIVDSVTATASGLEFSPQNVFEACSFRAVRTSSRPNARKPAPARADAEVLEARDFPAQALSVLKPGRRLRFSGPVSDVADDGGRFRAVFTFAGEDAEFLVERSSCAPRAALVPDIRDLRYGPHFRQTIDFYRARSAGPVPLVVSIHGGGWLALDKSLPQVPFRELLDRGISVAAIDYRYCLPGQDGLEPPVEAPLLDAARAVQFLRSKASELGIDKTRVAATGGSAGGFSALWLAYHDDLADPASPDPVARESTRLTAVGGTMAQTSLDPAQMTAWLPGITYGPHAFGVRSDGRTKADAFAEFAARRGEWAAKGYIADFSPWALVRAGAPATYLEYPGAPLDPPSDAPPGWQTHSPRWGDRLKRRLDSAGVECHLTYSGAADPDYPTLADFLAAKLKAPSPSSGVIP